MTETVETPSPPSISLSTWLAFGFVAGFLSVLTFHQGTGGLFYYLGWSNNFPYPMRPVPPLGVPQFVSLAFWGGIWLTVFTAISTRLPASMRTGLAFVIAGFVFGGFVISPFNWFILAPLRGQPLGNGFVPTNMLRGVVINGIFGLGGAIWLLAIQRLRASRK